MIKGKYILELWCISCSDIYKNRFPVIYEDSNEFNCIRKARKEGWTVGSKNQICPECNSRQRKKIKQIYPSQMITKII